MVPRPAAGTEKLSRCRETSLDFMRAMHPVAQRVLSCFATGLGLPADYFQQMTDVDNPENRTFLQVWVAPARLCLCAAIGFGSRPCSSIPVRCEICLSRQLCMC